MVFVGQKSRTLHALKTPFDLNFIILKWEKEKIKLISSFIISFKKKPKILFDSWVLQDIFIQKKESKKIEPQRRLPKFSSVFAYPYYSFSNFLISFNNKSLTFYITGPSFTHAWISSTNWKCCIITSVSQVGNPEKNRLHWRLLRHPNNTWPGLFVFTFKLLF